MGRRVFVTEPIHPDALALLREHDFQVIGPDAALRPADALLVRTRAISGQDVQHYAMISKHGVGVDNIALDAAATAGVAVMNTPGANASAVAEQTILFMLALARNFDAQRAAVPGQPVPKVMGLEGRRLLIIGFGATGKRVAALAKALGMNVTIHSRDLKEARHLGYPVAPDLAKALAHADVVSLHCPLTAQTQNILGAEAFAQMPAGALLVNCARGGLVDEAALCNALNSGHLGGAGLDVTVVEPLPQDDPLRKVANVIITPHAATLSDGAFRRMGMMAAQNILDYFAGRAKTDYTILPKD
ncbi:NAD(P)-dependent oxidoreductase [Pseudorhodobacter sp. W20_MBD10_FR17]|uniref:NAD(P)-dependent oxidoreductase n=1 Tax=Pseudorhodobacter sp. W20_MBD10_FR17 TaxID=3240266 RepID=UPI003F954F11